jgi:cysteine desulfurase/selenocysteine lyase
MKPGIHKDFPILNRVINSNPLVYLDNAATTQKPKAVISSIKDFYLLNNANVHRGIHTISEEATEAYEKARDKVADLIKAPDSSQIIFTKNATEAINLVAHSWGMDNLKKDDVILLSRMEHHANLIPWQVLAGLKGARLKFIELDGQGRLKVDQIGGLLKKRVKLVSITHVSNVLGTINPVKEIVRMAHDEGAVVMIDGAQSVPHLPVDVCDLDCDFMAFSGHKMLGPTGIGVLFGRQELLEKMSPFITGGEMILDVTWENATWCDPPHKFEAGTPCIAQAVGLGTAVDYLKGIGLDSVKTHIHELVTHALERLKEIDNLILYGPGPDERTGVVSFNVPGIHSHDLATLLDEQGVAIRAGHHCAQPLIESLGLSGTARASFYIYNTKEDVDCLIRAIQYAMEVFGV